MRVMKCCSRYIFQIVILPFLMLKVTFASALTIGQPFPNFTLPSAYVGYAQQLNEQHGKPVMLVVLDHCNRCENKLLNFQHLHTTYAVDGLVTWVIWSSHKDDQPPHLSLPVLQSDSRLQVGWQVPENRPALFLINRDGVLDHAIYGSIRTLRNRAKPLLAQWMQQNQTRLEGQ